MTQTPDTPTHHLIGGGIAALSAAVFLIRDAAVAGPDIRIYEQLDKVGGSLDGSGDAGAGYLTRGGRMFEPHFACTFDLFDSIPSADDPGVSVSQDIFDFNKAVTGSSKCRLIKNGQKADMDHLGLSAHDIVDINRMLLKSEHALKDHTIYEMFQPEFFDTNFWVMWSTMFSFQQWHSAVEMRRYLRRFIHLFPGFTKIEGILRTRYNQYDSLIAPLVDWLTTRGVVFRRGVTVENIDIVGDLEERLVSKLHLAGGEEVAVGTNDRVYITLGSMTDGSVTGSNSEAPPLVDTESGGWKLWHRLADTYEGFGRPDAFCGDTGKTAWHSFTVTMDGPQFFDFMEQFTGNRTGTGGLVTFRDSGWTLSIVMFHQPHFKAQADGTYVFWGYGLRGDREGDFVTKPMWQATGDEIIAELAGQLRLSPEQRAWFDGARVIPCRMPFITSQFMPRLPGDRPNVRPQGAANFVVIGQFCQIARDTVFTVEYSVRSARMAVHAMTGRGSPPPPVARTDRDPVVLLKAARVLMGL